VGSGSPPGAPKLASEDRFRVYSHGHVGHITLWLTFVASLKHRLFLAIVPPAEVISRITALQVDLDKLRLPIRWEPAANLHITLNFFGRVPEEKIPQLSSIISGIAANTPVFFLTPAYLAGMYRRHEPSFPYLSIADPDGILKDLRKELAQGVSRLQLPQPERFIPHITLGKFQKTDPTQTKQFLDKLSDHETEPLSSFEVQNLIMFESLLSRDGATYQRLAAFPLSR